MTELNKKNLLLLQISKDLARTRHHVTFCMQNLTVVIMRFPGGCPTPRLETSRLMYSRVVRFVDSWIFITERLCCRFMNVIRETYIFSPLWENWTQMVVCRFVRVVQVVDSWIFITETMETICIIYFCGNHSNLFDASVMVSVFTDNVISSRLLFVLHFIGEGFWTVNDFIRVAKRYCFGIIEDDKGEGQVSVEKFRSEAESLLFLNSQVLCTHYNLCFKELHQSPLMSGVPMGTIFITER